MADTKRINELAELIEKYQKSYYTGEAEISDAEFDALWDELFQAASLRKHAILFRWAARKKPLTQSSS